jgi:nicotinamidase-related amidase
MSRVWDRFLTAQDKAHLAATEKDRRVGFGSRPAVLNIDLYRGVFGDEPNAPLLDGVKQWSGYCGPAGWAVVPHVQALLREARALGIPICHATGLRDEDAGIPGWSAALHAGRSRKPPSDAAARDRLARRYDIIDEVAPLPGEVVVRKTAPSAFWGTPLMAELHRLGVDTLLVTGESTSGCVRATVVDAASYRFRVQVIEDCVFDRHEACHAMNLFDMNQKYADVISIGTALDYLRGLQNNRTDARKELVGS